jgi:hypothetical protein
MITHTQAIAQLQAIGGLTGMDIAVKQNYIGEWVAIDRNTYDCDCNEDGFVCTDDVGTGSTPLNAIIDLLDKKEEG